ncbi:hypothetical protein EPI10_034367 [Gossypium australe]|uniref:Uncharacterized protein n=1 Tax=Gossypium australe TaxID=47621 RepID=A0A5B6U4J9_9ROSI|nr:hypothetical protein EPI10_034367 [Gossypium australe]
MGWPHHQICDYGHQCFGSTLCLWDTRGLAPHYDLSLWFDHRGLAPLEIWDRLLVIWYHTMGWPHHRWICDFGHQCFGSTIVSLGHQWFGTTLTDIVSLGHQCFGNTL